MLRISPYLIKSAVAVLIVIAACFVSSLYISAGKMAPEVTFNATVGKPFSTRDLIGRVVLVNFWATSCATCVKEIPGMVDTFQKFHGEGLEFVAVAMSYDNPGYVDNFVASRKLPFRIAFDQNGSVAEAFGRVNLTPTTFLIGRDGKILRRYVGEPKFDELHAQVRSALRG